MLYCCEMKLGRSGTHAECQVQESLLRHAQAIRCQEHSSLRLEAWKTSGSQLDTSFAAKYVVHKWTHTHQQPAGPKYYFPALMLQCSKVGILYDFTQRKVTLTIAASLFLYSIDWRVWESLCYFSFNQCSLTVCGSSFHCTFLPSKVSH
jgi:hypothetical protein